MRDEQLETHRVSDVSDRATVVEQEALEDALRAAKRASVRDQAALPDGSYAITECVECGDEIGEARLKVAIHNTVCIHCQTEKERRGKWKL